MGILDQALPAPAHHVHHQLPMVEALVVLANEKEDEGELQLLQDGLDVVVVVQPGVQLVAGVQAVSANLLRTRAIWIFLSPDLGEVVSHIQQAVVPVTSGLVLFDQVNVQTI